jgi:hypothetical protein
LDEVESRDGNVVLTKWQDNKTVFVESDFVGTGIKKSVNRLDKT